MILLMISCFYLHLSLQIDKNIPIKVEATNEISDVFSLVIGRKGIVHNELHAVNGRSFTINVLATPAMIPSSKLIVYYIQNSGEIIFNQIELKFNQNFTYNVSIDLSSRDFLH